MAFLEVKNVSKHYAGHTALDQVSLSVRKGTVFGLLGPNGAGKTTLIRMITQITAPDEGEILMDDAPLQHTDICRVGYLPEERGLYRKMKVGEQALYLARLRGLSKAAALERLEYWFDKFDIKAWWNKKVEELSKGMQQKVQFICTIIHEPELLIFDEPFSGFDPINAELLKQEILELRQAGRTIIFSTHNMQSVEEICDDIALINRSKLILSGSVAEVREAHATNIIRLGISGELSESEIKEFAPMSTSYQHGITTLRLRRDNTTSNREFLLGLPSRYEVMNFCEEVPTMHEIFLHKIEENNYE